MKQWLRVLCAAVFAAVTGGQYALAADPTPADIAGYFTTPFYAALPSIMAIVVAVMLIFWVWRVLKQHTVKQKI